ncbi:MAG: PIN domain-containing protein [Methanocellales archaeon]|nr:PIN domain-containing protein [Methanocellales archaeon]
MIFLDASVIVAYKNADDFNHKRAVKIYEKIGENKFGRAMTSELVFSEVVTVLALRKDLQTAIEVGEVLRNARELTMVRASDVFSESWKIFREQKDANLSFVDASNIACMRYAGAKTIATFDKDFKKINDIEVVDG